MENTVSRPVVSVVVPVYNAERYLGMMVDSILCQTYRNFELLLVDDGGTDRSVRMVDDYAERDSRIRAVHKTNGGVSSARNAGIELARGEYIVFWDNDDYVYPDYLEVMVREAQGYDLLITRPVQFFGDGTFTPPERSHTGRCLAKSGLTQMSTVFPAIDQSEIAWVWAQLFRRDILVGNKVRFEKINSEDTLFSYQYLRCVNSIKMIDFTGYCYIHRAGSLSSTHKYVAEDDWIEKRYEIYQDIWARFGIDIDKNDRYRDAVFNRFAIRSAAFLLKGYHCDTFVRRKERMRRWRWAATSKVLTNVNLGGVNRKYRYFIQLSRYKLYLIADTFLYMLVTLRERIRKRQ